MKKDTSGETLKHITTNTFVIQVFLPESQDRPCSVTSPAAAFLANASSSKLDFCRGWFAITGNAHRFIDSYSVEKDFPSDLRRF